MLNRDPGDFVARAQNVRMLLFDVDGVLTDGSVNVTEDGKEFKRFYIKDGAALAIAKKAGLLVGIVSARESGANRARAEELKMDLVMQGVADKKDALALCRDTFNLTPEQIAFMGDDLVDLGLLGSVGLSACPADAAAEVAASVHWTSWHPGGNGAVREFIEALLKARNEWDDVLSRFA